LWSPSLLAVSELNSDEMTDPLIGGPQAEHMGSGAKNGRPVKSLLLLTDCIDYGAFGYKHVASRLFAATGSKVYVYKYRLQISFVLIVRFLTSHMLVSPSTHQRHNTPYHTLVVVHTN
jgi:hypothetical protein